MLVVKMPDDDKRRQKRLEKQIRAVAYMIAGGLILVAGFVAVGTNWWYATFAAEVWWLWAVWTGL